MVELDFFRKVILHLQEMNIPYWVYGGYACDGLYGEISREHDDIDLFVDETAIGYVAQLLSKKFDLEIVYRKNMYFLGNPQKGKHCIGLLPVRLGEKEALVFGNKTVETYSSSVFKESLMGSIDTFSFRVAPIDVLSFESQFSSHRFDVEVIQNYIQRHGLAPSNPISLDTL